MAKPRVLILRAPGTNCDLETAHAFERAGGVAERLHVNQIVAEPNSLKDFQILCLPGGFSYGDDIAAGRILGNRMRRHLAGALGEFKAAGKLILGICNGFQILLKTDVLLPMPAEGALATLALNDSGRFLDRWVQLQVRGDQSVFFRGIQNMYLPIAHAEGRFVPRDSQTLASLESAGQLCLRYSAVENPNGAVADVAGVCDETGRVCGLMPHPERHLDPTHHPQWTRRESQPPAGDGLKVFQNAVGYFA
jgi:phosphoribosylformylglycinamidine synthase